MKKQYKDLLNLYKAYIEIFNNWETTFNSETDSLDMYNLITTFRNITDILVRNKIIEDYGLKHYKVVETGEII